ANPKTVVVLIAGSPVEVFDWIDQIPAVMMGWYAGMEGGHALANVLFGEVNPSGKLPFTFPIRLEDSPAHALGEYPGSNYEVTYNEKIFVGYRYFDSKNIQSQFCFGHGLSYTDFEYGNLKINSDGNRNEPQIQIEITLRNRGDREGKEVVQIYVGDVEASVERPKKELKAFKKVNLSSGESKKVSFSLDKNAFSFYDMQSSSWKVEPGLFRIFIGGSSQDIRLSRDIEVF
ncbi:MAG: glycoside hydrolase family 3 C-terminal domain-containing protein, partial [bacterium]